MRGRYSPHKLHVDKSGRDQALRVRPLVQVWRERIARSKRLRHQTGKGTPLKTPRAAAIQS